MYGLFDELPLVAIINLSSHNTALNKVFIYSTFHGEVTVKRQFE